MRGHHGRKRSNRAQFLYERVLLAVYLRADAEGLFCNAANTEIGRDLGIAPETVGRYLADLERDGHIAIFHMTNGVRNGSGRLREMILTDHPDAGPACLWIEDIGGRRRVDLARAG